MTRWIERAMSAGKYRQIKELVAEGTHRIEIWGSSADGWAAYLVQGDAGVCIGPVFHRDFGDTMGMLRDVIRRTFGTDAKKGRGWL